MDDFPNVRHQTVRASEYWSEHVCVSHAQMIDISPYTNAPTPPSVIPLGYDPDTFFPPETASDQDRDTLLFAGAINYTKGFDILLQALQDLLTDFPRLKIRIAGGSNTKTKLSQETELKKLATDMGLEHCMQFLGFQTQNELAQLMRESTMLVSASRRETFGCVLVEAMGCGLPVVATSCGGPEDIVTDAVGILVEPENPTALADGIRTILRNRSSYTAGDIHAFASPRFSWDIAADQYISLYKRILLEAAADDDF
jgi:glycosyltransferase involved in cell wall biosynthesis